VSALAWFVVVAALGSVVIGAWRGLVFEVLSLCSWIVAFVVARAWGAALGRWLPITEMDEGIRTAAGFVLLFNAAMFACSFAIWLVGKLVKSVGLRPADRAMGAMFGLARGGLLLLLVALVFLWTPMRDSELWKTSAVAPHLVAVVSRLQPLLPQEMGEHWSSLVNRSLETASQVVGEPR